MVCEKPANASDSIMSDKNSCFFMILKLIFNAADGIAGRSKIRINIHASAKEN